MCRARNWSSRSSSSSDGRPKSLARTASSMRSSGCERSRSRGKSRTADRKPPGRPHRGSTGWPDPSRGRTLGARRAAAHQAARLLLLHATAGGLAREARRALDGAQALAPLAAQLVGALLVPRARLRHPEDAAVVALALEAAQRSLQGLVGPDLDLDHQSEDFLAGSDFAEMGGRCYPGPPRAPRGAGPAHEGGTIPLDQRPASERPASSGADSQVLQGVVDVLTFHSPQSLYTVLKVWPERGYGDPGTPGGRRTRVVAVGAMDSPLPGLRVRLHGQWSSHRVHGRQFEFDACEVLEPQGAEGVARYLASGAFPGVGETLAKRIVEQLGADALAQIRDHPESLAKVKGLRVAARAQLAERVRDDYGRHRLQTFLRSLGLGARHAVLWRSGSAPTPRPSCGAIRTRSSARSPAWASRPRTRWRSSSASRAMAWNAVRLVFRRRCARRRATATLCSTSLGCSRPRASSPAATCRSSACARRSTSSTAARRSGARRCPAPALRRSTCRTSPRAKWVSRRA